MEDNDLEMAAANCNYFGYDGQTTCNVQLAVGAARDMASTIGYSEVPASIFGCTASPSDWSRLRDCSLQLPPDPNMKLQNYRRGFRQYILHNDKVFPLDGITLAYGGSEAVVSGFDIGTANLETPGARVFAQLPDKFHENPAFIGMLKKAVDLDGCDPRAKRACLAQVFVQAAIVNEDDREIQAAPPDNPHNDECRFKANFMIGQHNYTGGRTYFLPREFSNSPFDDSAQKNVLKTISLNSPGHGYCFYDDVPSQAARRVANCHYAEPIQLGGECSVGYRIIATVTPTPLLPSMGDSQAVDETIKKLAANTTALLTLRDIVNGLSGDKKEQILSLIAD